MRTPAAVLGLFVALALLLVGAGSALAQTTTTTVVTAPAGEPICVTCHSYVSADVVDTWRSQNHGRKGVACPACHGGHDKDFTPKPMAKVCFGCHDVKAAHPDFTPETPGKRCMECHTANVHWLPGQQSWFQGGLPTSKLEQSTQKPAEVSASAGRTAGVIVVIIAAIAGLIAGLVFNRFVREL
jgi:nitrate/TMAO reductase-like tetraheme cytochrome c subunit